MAVEALPHPTENQVWFSMGWMKAKGSKQRKFEI
jgi:hypothetical protein